MKTIVFTGGGTLGHCIPNLAVFDRLNHAFDRFYYIGSEAGPEKKAVDGIMEYMPITTTKLSRGFHPENALIPLKLIKGIRQAENILRRVNANIVFSKGGFVSVPVCFAASRLGIPIISHESDLTLGLANRLTKNKSKYILTSFSTTAESVENGIYTGPPISERALVEKPYAAKAKYLLPHKKPVLLVVGGSSGAKGINDFIFENLSLITQKYEVLHICGDKHTNNLKADGYCQVGFEKDMAIAYSACDYALSRCGSNTAFELLARYIPTVFVPLPKKASRGDQIANAAYFEKKRLSLTIEEERLNAENLFEKLKTLEDNSAQFVGRMRALNLKTSAKKIADIVIAEAKKSENLS